MASCPQLRTVMVCRTKLARSYKGDAPLIKKYLIDRIGMNVVRDENTKTVRPKMEYRFHHHKVDESMPGFEIIGFWAI